MDVNIMMAYLPRDWQQQVRLEASMRGRESVAALEELWSGVLLDEFAARAGKLRPGRKLARWCAATHDALAELRGFCRVEVSRALADRIAVRGAR